MLLCSLGDSNIIFINPNQKPNLNQTETLTIGVLFKYINSYLKKEVKKKNCPKYLILKLNNKLAAVLSQ